MTCGGTDFLNYSAKLTKFQPSTSQTRLGFMMPEGSRWPDGGTCGVDLFGGRNGQIQRYVLSEQKSMSSRKHSGEYYNNKAQARRGLQRSNGL